MLCAVLVANRYAQHHRHFQRARTHGLPFGELVEHLVTRAAQEIAVHQLGDRPSAHQRVADGAGNDGALADRGIEEAVIRQRFGQAPVYAERAAPIAVVLTKGDQGRVLIELVDNRFKQRIAYVELPDLGDSLAVFIKGIAAFF